MCGRGGLRKGGHGDGGPGDGSKDGGTLNCSSLGLDTYVSDEQLRIGAKASKTRRAFAMPQEERAAAGEGAMDVEGWTLTGGAGGQAGGTKAAEEGTPAAVARALDGARKVMCP